MKKTFLAGIAAVLLTWGAASASAEIFLDVPASSPYYVAIESLVQRGVLQGYVDNTFKPQQTVNRAEALKMILAGGGVAIKKGLYSTGFPDVPLDAWYAGYVMEGSLRGIIQGNPDGTFAGERTVNKAEFLKMVTQAFEVDLSQHQGGSENIAADVAPEDWFFPYLSYGKTVGLTYPTINDNLEPGKLLTRGESAQIIYKMGLIKYGGEAQKMLSIAESKLIDALIRVYNNDINTAIARGDEALYFSGLALQLEPKSTAVQSTHLIAQAFQKLFLAYSAGIEQSYAQVVGFVNEANALADKAVEINSSAAFFAEKIHEHGDTLLSQLTY